MDAENTGTPVRIVSWNVQGRAMDDPVGIARRLDELRADIVCFQEIHRSQFARVRATSRLVHGTWWFKHWSIRYAAEGLAVASRWPITETPGSVVLSHPWRLVHHTRRIVGGVTIATDADPLHVWNTHLASGDPDRRRVEVARLLEVLPTARTILAGDLNVRPGAPELVTFAEAGWTDGHDIVHPDVVVATNLTDDRTALKQRLDYVLVSPDLAGTVTDAAVPGATEPIDRSWWALSDHLPLVVDLVLPATIDRHDRPPHG